MRNLDLNTLHQPAMSLTLRDKNKTVLHLELATVELVERLQRTIPELKQVVSGNSMRGVQMLYEMTADILSFNRENIQFTADSLKTVYKINLQDMLAIFNAYLEFIGEVKSAKN